MMFVAILTDAAPVLGENLSIFSPVAPPADSIRSLSVLVLAITAGIFVLVEAILLYAVVRFRRAKGTEGGEPPQVYGSKPIEIAWTAAPALVVFVLVLVTARTLWEVDRTPPQPKPGDRSLFVKVVGRQWWWEYRYEIYDGQAITAQGTAGQGGLPLVTANELHLPAGNGGGARPIYLQLQSADVCHSFWVPRLAGKLDLIPGRTNHLWFQTDRPGTYLGQCAEYCGTQHAGMLLRVIVEPHEKFWSWLEQQRRPAEEVAAVQAGRRAFLSQSCVNCHRIRGTPAEGTFGPDLTHLMSRQTLASGRLVNTPDNLRRWVADPQREKPGCLMPAFGLSQRELDLIVDYLLTLR